MASDTLRFFSEDRSASPSSPPGARLPDERNADERLRGRRVCSACGNRYGESSIFCPIDGQPLVSSGDIEGRAGSCVGRVLCDRYQIESLLGEGTLGEVYRARHLELGRVFAVKVLKRSLSNRPSSCERFLREARAAGKIDHSKVVRITDSGMTDDRPFFVMELSPGVSLEKLLGGDLMEPRRAAHVARQIAEGLRAAHEAGVIHRALKPSNILIDANDRDSVKVLDFGLARVLGEQSLTEPGLVVGAPEYMSPEHAAGGEADARSDQYSFGLVLYQMLAGRLPFRGSSFSEVVEKQLHERPEPLNTTFPHSDLLEELEPVVMRCLQKDPGLRFESMAEVIAALDGAMKRAKHRHASLLDPSSPLHEVPANDPQPGLFAQFKRWMAQR